MSELDDAFPEKVEDFDAALVFNSDEWTALADYCAREVWVWERVAQCESGKDRTRSEQIAETYRTKGRAYKAYAAQEEKTQTEWEAANPREP